MNKHTEYDKRCEAISYYENGVPFERILGLVQRGRFWLAKWLRRYKEHGLEAGIGVEPQKGFGGALLNPWLKLSCALGRSWNPIGLSV